MAVNGLFAPIFPETFYHLFHYEFDTAGTLAENDDSENCENTIHSNA